jgi:hypothetical protein
MQSPVSVGVRVVGMTAGVAAGVCFATAEDLRFLCFTAAEDLCLVCFATRDDLCFACFATTGEVAAKYDAPDTASKQSTTVIRQQLRGTVWLSRRRSRFGRSILVQRRALAYPQGLPRFHPAVDRSRWLSMTWDALSAAMTGQSAILSSAESRVRTHPSAQRSA